MSESLRFLPDAAKHRFGVKYGSGGGSGGMDTHALVTRPTFKVKTLVLALLCVLGGVVLVSLLFSSRLPDKDVAPNPLKSRFAHGARTSQVHKHKRIFVYIKPHKTDATVCKALVAAFQGADHPERVFVGVCVGQGGVSDARALMAAYADATPPGVTRRYFDNVRFANLDDDDSGASGSFDGTLGADSTFGAAATPSAAIVSAAIVSAAGTPSAEARMYRNEDYAARIAATVLLQPHWDSVLIREHDAAVAATGAQKSVVITCEPPIGPPSEDLQLPSFLYVHPRLDVLPRFGAKQCATRPMHPYYQLGVSPQFLFSDGARVTHVPLPDSGAYVVGLLLFTHGWTPVMPTECPATALGAHVAADHDNDNVALQLAIAENRDARYPLGPVDTALWEQFLNLSLVERWVSDASVGGVFSASMSPASMSSASTQTLDSSEILAKHGSATAFRDHVMQRRRDGSVTARPFSP